MLLLVSKLLIAFALMARLYWRPARSREMIHRWAADHHYKVLAIRTCRFFRGPFVTTKEQAVFRVVMKVEGNKQRTAWIACGGCLRGLGSHQLHLWWDDTNTNAVHTRPARASV